MNEQRKRPRLTINRCPVHGFWSVSIDGDHGGSRITPSKCCGHWTEVDSWLLSPEEWVRVAEKARKAEALAVEEWARAAEKAYKAKARATLRQKGV